MLELYNLEQSTCSQKVRICMHEKELTWTDILLNWDKQEHLSLEYLKINPNGVVPTLVHDGQSIIDSSVIVEYVDEVFLHNPLSPANPVKRAHMREWMRYIEEVPTTAVRVPSFNKAILRFYNSMSEDEFAEKQLDIRPLRNDFYRRMGTDGFSDVEVENSMAQLKQTVERMESSLKNGPWLIGEMFSLADIVVAPLIDRMDDLGFSYLWKEGNPEVEGWLARIRQRASFKKAFYKGSRLSDILEIAEGNRVGTPV